MTTAQPAPTLPLWVRDEATRRAAVVAARARLGQWARALPVGAPKWLLLAVCHVLVGLGRVSRDLSRWIHDQDSAELQRGHAWNEETPEYVKIHAVRRSHLHARMLVAGGVLVAVGGPIALLFAPYVLSAALGLMLAASMVKAIPGRGLGELAVAAAGGAAVYWFGGMWFAQFVAPQWLRWALYGAVAGGALLLERKGRPAPKDNDVAHRLAAGPPSVKLDVIRDALCTLGVPGMKDPELIEALQMPHRHGAGVQVEVQCPAGVEAVAVMAKGGKLASALRREEKCVHLSRGRRNAGHLIIYVADQPMTEQDQGKWALNGTKPRSIFEPFPVGTNARGEWVSLTLAYANAVIGAVPRVGKALDVTTPVPTPSGWTTMGELRDGDEVFDEQGRPCRVVVAHPVRIDRPCYRVAFSDGSDIVADAEHLWQVETRSGRVHGWPEKVLTTADMLDTVRVEADGRANYSVRVAGALQLPEANLPIPPYTLGAWLGDGTAVHGALTVGEGDEATLEQIRAEGYLVTERPSARESGRAPYYGVWDLMVQLRGAGLLDNKHIPAAYFRASEQQRRALLAGLLDTDGWVQNASTVMFGSMSKNLAEDVRRLVATLGYTSTMRSKNVHLKGRDYGTFWQVTFCPDQSVFRLPRKVERQTLGGKASNHRRFITAIDPVPSVPVRCITVDSPSSLYLVGEQCIPTHNTFALRELGVAAAHDLRVKVCTFDGKGTGDFRPLEPIAHFRSVGDDPEEIERVLGFLRGLRREMRRRASVLATLSADECPENKIDDRLANRDGFEPYVLIIDETQTYFCYGSKSSKEDKAVRAEFEEIITDFVKRGPAMGFIVLLATQSVNSDTIPRGISTNAVIRFALRLFDHTSVDLVLGTGAYSKGLSTTEFDADDKGIGILRGDGNEPQMIRTVHGLDGPTVRAMAQRLAKLRAAAGRLTGQAAGEDIEPEPTVDFLADVAEVVLERERRNVSLARLRDELAEDRPETWGTLTVDSLGAQLREARVRVAPVWDAVEGKTVKGVKPEWVRAARDGDVEGSDTGDADVVDLTAAS